MSYYGIQKHTLIDFPGEVACTLFTGGCNFCCPYCHNRELVEVPIILNQISFDEILFFLKTRKGLLGGVCITGGEPLINKNIIDDIKKIKDLGFKVKIDTNGSYPDILKKLEVDYIAMDLKSSFNKYQYVCKDVNEIDSIVKRIKESIKYIIESNIDNEIRTTVVPYIVEIKDMPQIADEIKGITKYVLAQFRPHNTLNPDWAEIEPYPISVLKEMQQIILNRGIPCYIRNI